MSPLLSAFLRYAAGVGGLLLGTATLTFLAMVVVPGNPLDMIVGTDSVRPEIIAQIEADLGLDKPLHVQYFDYLGRLLHGDLGMSYQLRRPVRELIFDNLSYTAELAVLAAVLALAGATLLAVLTAGGAKWVRGAISTFELVTIAMPSFFIGLILLFIFSFKLRWLPVVNNGSFSALILPAVTLALGSFGVMAQLMRDGLEAALRQPFALTARARGRRSIGVKLVHGLPHSLIPVLTVAGTLLGSLLGGAVLTENVFGRPGIGRLTLQAVTTRDMPVVMGVVMLAVLTFCATSVLVDILHRLIDPRLRQRRAVIEEQPR